MNFNTMPPRQHTNCEKWDGLSRSFPKAAPDSIPLWVADMDFACAPEILTAVRRAYDCEALGYRFLPDAFADAVRHWMQSRHALGIDPSWVLPLPGVVSGISACISAFTQPGDGVIVQPPVYPPFFETAKRLGRTVLENPLVESEVNGTLRYGMDFDHLAALCAQPKAKMLVLCSPHNPVGRLFTAEELARVARICAENGVYLVSDEIHSDIILQGRFTPILSVAGRSGVCQLGSPSKSFNTAGTHTAYMIVPDPVERGKLREFWNALHIPTESFVSSEVITAAYRQAAYYVDELCPYIAENVAFLAAYLRTHLPKLRLADTQATYLMWADASAYGPDVFDRLCQAGAVPDPGSWFGQGSDGYIRLNTALPRPLLAEAAERIMKAL